MKKAKLFLTAITILAIVGGALAFKAKKVNTVIYTDDPQNHICTVLVPGYEAVAGAPNTFASSAPTQVPCPETKTIVNE